MAPGWDEEVDLVVLGAGAGGMVAALVGALRGMSVLVIEASALVGGTMATSAGTLWLPGTRHSERAGVPDSVAAARRYLAAELPGAADDPVREAFLTTADEAVAFLEERSEVRFAAAPRHPDYHPGQPGAAPSGRALVALPFDGRRLGADFALLRPPRREFMVLGGMMVGKDDIPPLLRPFASVAAFRHVAGLVLRQALDRLSYPRGTRLVMGNALAARLLHALRQAGVVLRTGTRVAEILRDGEAVTGVATEAGGARRRVRARCGVVVATGGYSGSAAWRARLFGSLPIPHSVANPGNAGGGLDLALAAGAALDERHASPAFWMPASVLERPDGTRAIFPHIILDRAKPGLIAVNAAGRRFVNEAESYHDFVLGMLRAPSGVPAVPAWLVCDRRFLRDYGMGMVHPGRRDLRRFLAAGYLRQGATPAALAMAIGVDPAGLEASLAQHNRDAVTGLDTAFGKGSTALNRHNGDPAHGPNPCLRPIDAAPFYAMAVWPADLATSIGLRADADARVLDVAGQAIPGLYACGNDMASVMRGAYPGPGVTLGPALVFGYRAASHAAQRNKG
jgi:succinate dehydrogenase/fumarate reductase flavoprotein subunit